MTLTEDEVEVLLLPLKRCDYCVQQGVSTFTKDDLELVLCGHDSHKHEDALIASGWKIATPEPVPAAVPEPEPVG